MKRCKANMNIMDNKTKVLIFSPFALAIILATAANYIDIPFKKGIPEAANSIAAFTPAGLTIKDRQRFHSRHDVRGPLDYSHSTATEMLVTTDTPVPQDTPKDKSLSLIIVSGTDKTAIINGVPVKEGDQIADMRIVKIETDRVLLKNKTLKWMYLE